MSDALFPRFSPVEYRRRYDAISALMERRDLDGLVVYADGGSFRGNLANAYYLTGFMDPWFAYVLLRRGGEPRLYVSNALFLPHAQTMADVAHIDWVTWDVPGKLAAELGDMGLARGRLGLVAPGTTVHNHGFPHAHLRGLRDALPGAELVDASDVLLEVRRIKSEPELERVRRGAALTDGAVAALAGDARPGMTEHELAGILHAAAAREGGEQRVTFLGSTAMDRPELVFPRQEPALRHIGTGDIVLTELSTAYGGYAGQIHRPLTVGGGPSAQYARLFEAARAVFDAVFDVLGPGTTADDIRAIAGPVFRKYDVLSFDTLLHGWGLTIEGPSVDVPDVALIPRPARDYVLQEGMLLVLQPHVVSADRRRGLQLGSLCLVTSDGAEALQRSPMQPVTIG